MIYLLNFSIRAKVSEKVSILFCSSPYWCKIKRTAKEVAPNSIQHIIKCISNICQPLCQTLENTEGKHAIC